MTRDDVIQIVMSMTPPDDFVDAQIDEKLLDEFMPLFEAIAAAERERIAKWVEEQRNDIPATGIEFASAIRARSDV